MGIHEGAEGQVDKENVGCAQYVHFYSFSILTLCVFISD
jgi:hypothetical protein